MRRNLLVFVWVLCVGLSCLACGGSDYDQYGQFSIIVLPDTQYYSEGHPEIFIEQTRWISSQVNELNVRIVLHVGDVVEDNFHEQWEVAEEAFSYIDGEVPYAIAVGNHDYGYWDEAAGRRTWETRETLFNEYFPVWRFQEMVEFQGVYDEEPDRMDNCFFVFDAGDRQWLILVLEFAPRDEILEWADRVVSENSGSSVIVLTHLFLQDDGSRYAKGQEMWDAFISRYENVCLVICGHRYPPVSRTDSGLNGNQVHQMMVNYQDRENGGNGWLRILTFRSSGWISVQDYSPTLDRYAKGEYQSYFISSP